MFSVIDIAALVVFSLLGMAIVVITVAFLFFSHRSRPAQASPNSSPRFNRGSSILEDIELQERPSRPEPAFMQTRYYEYEFSSPYPYPHIPTTTFDQQSGYSFQLTNTLDSVSNTTIQSR
jgi:hypothetical protein